MAWQFSLSARGCMRMDCEVNLDLLASHRPNHHKLWPRTSPGNIASFFQAGEAVRWKRARYSTYVHRVSHFVVRNRGCLHSDMFTDPATSIRASVMKEAWLHCRGRRWKVWVSYRCGVSAMKGMLGRQEVRTRGVVGGTAFRLGRTRQCVRLQRRVDLCICRHP